MASSRWLGHLSPPARFGLKLLFILLLGEVGQLGMAQPGEGLSLGLGLVFYGLAVYFLFKLFPNTKRIHRHDASSSGTGLHRAKTPRKSNQLLKSKSTSTFHDETISFPVEGIFFFLILALGILLRAAGANHYPEGIFADRAEVACGALQILHDHWRPSLEALNLHVPEICIYYMAAGWFKLFGESPEHFAYFDVVLSTTGIVLMYFAFRLWTGPRGSLLAFFLLAVMRWNFAFAHQAYFQAQTVFFMSLTLAALSYALRKQKPVWGAVAGLAMGAGLYSYQALKAVPVLVLVLMFYEAFRDRERFGKNREVWGVCWVVFLLSAAPLLDWIFENGQLGRREPEVSILARIHFENSLWPLWENIRDILLVFNHKMVDGNSQSNFSHHRILDDVTGVLFVLGYFYALRRAKERPFFTALAGLGVMSLPGFFSVSGSNLGRLLGDTPFVALLCGLFLADVWRWWKSLKPSSSLNRTAVVLSLGLLAASGLENAYLFFQVQAHQPDCVNDCSWSESKAGRLIAGLPPGTQSFLTSRFYGHPTVQYLTYPNWEGMHPLDLTQPPQPGSFPKGSDFCFVLDEFKQGTLEFLGKLYPGGRPFAIQDPLGKIPLYVYQVPPQALEKIHPESLQPHRGLLGVYGHSENEREAPFLNRWNPILNFNYRDLPGVGGPLYIHWAGKFDAVRGGKYRLWGAIFATSRGRILVDQKDKNGFTGNPYWEGNLKPGWHRLDFYYRDKGSPVATVSLLWKPPGNEKYDFMPNEVLGKIQE